MHNILFYIIWTVGFTKLFLSSQPKSLQTQSMWHQLYLSLEKTNLLWTSFARAIVLSLTSLVKGKIWSLKFIVVRHKWQVVLECFATFIYRGLFRWIDCSSIKANAQVVLLYAPGATAASDPQGLLCCFVVVFIFLLLLLFFFIFFFYSIINLVGEEYNKHQPINLKLPSTN